MNILDKNILEKKKYGYILKHNLLLNKKDLRENRVVFFLVAILKINSSIVFFKQPIWNKFRKTYKQSIHNIKLWIKGPMWFYA